MKLKMPEAGEGWRHYKRDLYRVVGLGYDEQGTAVVVYTPWEWSLASPPPIYTRKLGTWFDEIDIFEDADGKRHRCARFVFEREPR